MDCYGYRAQNGVKWLLRTSICSNFLFIAVTIWRFTWRRTTTKSHSSAQCATGVTTQRRPWHHTCRTTRRTSNSNRTDTTTAAAAAPAAVTRLVLELPARPSAVCSVAKRSGSPRNCRWDRYYGPLRGWFTGLDRSPNLPLRGRAILLSAKNNQQKWVSLARLIEFIYDIKIDTVVWN